MHLAVTALYTGLFLLLMVALAVNVVRLRMREGISLGDGDNQDLRKAIRSHANATEYVPLVLIGLGALESQGAAPSVLHIYGSVFFLARISHVLGLAQSRSVNKSRQLGILFSWLTMIALASHLLTTVFHAASV